MTYTQLDGLAAVFARSPYVTSVRRVFLSSTYKDLVDLREVARATLDTLGHYVVRMENFPASSWAADDFCQRQVKESDVFVGLIGGCYGSCPPNSELSFTEREYLTAVQLQKPCLLFLADENFPVPKNLIEEDTVRRKLDDFRDRLRQRHICAFFTSAEVLKEALFKAFLELCPPSFEILRRSAENVPIGELGVGSQLAKSCDRSTQERQFLAFARQHLVMRPGRPHIYVVHGDESERPRSFVDRLYHEKIKAWNRPDQDSGSVPRKVDIEWPNGWGPEEGEQVLRVALFEKFDAGFPNTKDLSAMAFSNLPKLQEHSFVVIQHTVHSQHWEKETLELASRYFSFWNEVGSSKCPSQFLIFFTVIYSSRPEDFLRATIPARIKRHVVKELRQLMPGGIARNELEGCCPRLMMDELSCVKFVEVQDWLVSPPFAPLLQSSREITQQLEKLFAGSAGSFAACKPMAEIEDYVEGILHQQFNPVR